MKEPETKWILSASCKHKFCGQCPFMLEFGDALDGVHRTILAMCNCVCHKDIQGFMASVVESARRARGGKNREA